MPAGLVVSIVAVAVLAVTPDVLQVAAGDSPRHAGGMEGHVKPLIVVHSPTGHRPGRLVEIRNIPIGYACCAEDVIEFARLVGLDDVDFTDTELIAWRGGGPNIWSE